MPTENKGAVEIGITENQIKDWIGGLWIELQLTRQQLRDYQQALSQARLELEEMKKRDEQETDNGT